MTVLVLSAAYRYRCSGEYVKTEFALDNYVFKEEQAQLMMLALSGRKINQAPKAVSVAAARLARSIIMRRAGESRQYRMMARALVENSSPDSAQDPPLWLEVDNRVQM